jgi:hypothetical protein
MRKILGISALVMCLVLPAAAQATKKHCIDPRQVRIGTGKSLSGEEWEAFASIRENGNSCRDWLFGVDFTLPGVGEWGSATGIPAGGHTSRYFTISANEFQSEDGTEAVFSGYAGREVATIKAWMQNGTMMEVHPRFPPMQLRTDFVWLRSFRYFVHYFPAESIITKVALFTRGGRLVYRASREDGSFW